jgi:hypothetical protein
MKNIKRDLIKYLYNLPGWRTKRKIVVIESDDWGSIRMPSYEVYEKCLLAGYPVDKNAYERYDSLASEEDLTFLFDLLKSIKDYNGNHPLITANCVVANPDFKKIREENFEKYHYELITETFKRYPNHSKNFDLWKKGIEEKVFFPQYHAREHLNVSKFMNSLQKGDKDVLWGFENEMPGSIKKLNRRNGNYFVESTHYNSEDDKKNKLKIYLEGLEIFEKLFGYNSQSVIPTNYIWSSSYNEALAEKGVKFIQGIRKMKEPVPGKKPTYSNRRLGKLNRNGQIDLVRNVTFEPSISCLLDPLSNCLKEINIAFNMNKPAIISSHRLNFVGFIDKKNRDKNLQMLKQLFEHMIKLWPDVEFLNTVELGVIIKDELIHK